MSERLVEYFVVAGVGKAEPSLAASNGKLCWLYLRNNTQSLI